MNLGFNGKCHHLSLILVVIWWWGWFIGRMSTFYQKVCGRRRQKLAAGGTLLNCIGMNRCRLSMLRCPLLNGTGGGGFSICHLILETKWFGLAEEHVVLFIVALMAICQKQAFTRCHKGKFIISPSRASHQKWNRYKRHTGTSAQIRKIYLSSVDALLSRARVQIL